MSKWLRLDDEIDGEKWQVVIPESDIKPHSAELVGNKRELADSNCPCKPQINWFDNIIIHNSFEDSEAIEKSLQDNFIK